MCSCDRGDIPILVEPWRKYPTPTAIMHAPDLLVGNHTALKEAEAEAEAEAEYGTPDGVSKVSYNWHSISKSMDCAGGLGRVSAAKDCYYTSLSTSMCLFTFHSLR